MMRNKAQGSHATLLCLACSERHSRAAVTFGSLGSRGELDLAKLLLVAKDVLLQGEEQALSVLRSHDDTGEDLRRSDGEHVRKVDHKLRAGMVDHCEIGVLTLRNLGLELYLYLILLFILIVCHCFYNLKVWVKYFIDNAKITRNV